MNVVGDKMFDFPREDLNQVLQKYKVHARHGCLWHGGGIHNPHGAANDHDEDLSR